MNIYKWIGTILLGVVVLLLLIALVLPSSYTVKRSATINRPVSEVFPMVSDYKNWIQWNPWFPLDPTVKTVLSSPSFGKGSSWKWTGLKIGSGQLTTLDEVENKSILAKLEFLAPYEMTSTETWTFEATKGETKITWTDSGKLGYPMGRFLGPFLDSKMGPDFEKGLAKIKLLCEKK